MKLCKTVPVYSVDSIESVLKMGMEIGSGSFGVVYNVHGFLLAKEKYKLVAKVVKREAARSVRHEANLMAYAAQLDIGPRVPENFYLRSGGQRVLLMEKFDMDLSTFLRHDTLPTDASVRVIEEDLKRCFMEMTKHSMLCTDIKARNALIQTEPVKARLSDFDICCMHNCPRDSDMSIECSDKNWEKRHKVVAALNMLQLSLNVFHGSSAYKKRILFLDSIRSLTRKKEQETQDALSSSADMTYQMNHYFASLPTEVPLQRALQAGDVVHVTLSNKNMILAEPADKVKYATKLVGEAPKGLPRTGRATATVTSVDSFLKKRIRDGKSTNVVQREALAILEMGGHTLKVMNPICIWQTCEAFIDKARKA